MSTQSSLTFPLQPGDPDPNVHTGAVAPQAQNGAAAGFGIGVYAILAIGGAVAYFGYQYLQQQQQQQPSA